MKRGSKQLVLMGFLLGIMSLTSCLSDVNTIPLNTTFTCDAENKGPNNKFTAVEDSTILFGNGKNQSRLESYTGKHSVLTSPKAGRFAMTLEIEKNSPGSYYEISVWRKSKDDKGVLVISADNANTYYKASSGVYDTDINGWEKIELEAFVPPNFNGGKLKVYVWNNGNDTIFFDDLKITRLTGKSYPDYNYNEGINLLIDTSDYLKIMQKRVEAFDNGILQTDDNDWFKGIMVYNDVAMKTDARLKGDWLDHLWGDKWSYRLKLKNKNTFKRMRTFSLQSPAARNFLNEWLSHELFRENDVLTTRYGFVPLMVNGRPRGLYVYEEHFDKQLLEWNNRREGPIVKFTEDAFWQYQKMKHNTDITEQYPFYEASTIVPFKSGRTVSNPVLYNQFLDAQKLMLQYKGHTKQTHEIFDTDKLAMYYALLDLTQAYHGRTWHNQRLYFNPVIRKLEPIAFDGYYSNQEFDFSINVNMLYHALTFDKPMLPYDYQLFSLFTDTIFAKKYLEKLTIVSNEKYIDDFYAFINAEEELYDSLIGMEFPVAPYDKDLLRKSAASIISYLPELTNLLETKIKQGNFTISAEKIVFPDSTIFEDSPNYFVSAYTKSTGDSLSEKKIIEVVNTFPAKINIVGSSIDDQFITDYFSESRTIDGFRKGSRGKSIDINVDKSSTILYFTVTNSDEIFSTSIFPWPYPEGLTSQQELCSTASVDYDIIDHVKGNNVYIKDGVSEIKSPVVIPEGYNVFFKEGTVIDIINGALFMSYSPVFIDGAPDNPVVIKSSDFSANGFTVLQAEGKSKVNNARFENMNTLNYKGWFLTGAVTFYESNVEISNAVFYRNQCEDALNIIRSKFTVDDCSFEYTYGDAFDADFCEGIINNNSYTNISNDAMDFSGSQIIIRNTTVTDANDKGISGGEDSQLEIDNVSIISSNIGLASKDLSIVKANNCTINDCKYGLVLLVKKPEYGPSSMILNNTKINNSVTEHLIEVNSYVVIDNDTIKGVEENVSALFY